MKKLKEAFKSVRVKLFLTLSISILIIILLLIIIEEIIYEKTNSNLILFHNCGCFSQISNGFIAYLIIIFFA